MLLASSEELLYLFINDLFPHYTKIEIMALESPRTRLQICLLVPLLFFVY